MDLGDRRDRDGGIELLVRWSLLIIPMALGGLLLAARAADGYTETVGFLFVGFALLLAARLIARIAP